MDFQIIETGTGGDLVIQDDDLLLTNSFKNQIYIALFGGNINSESGEQSNDYWGNTFLPEGQKFKSTLESNLSQIVINSSGIAKIKSLVEADLEFLKPYANINIDVSINSKDSLTLSIDVIAPNNVSDKIRILWNNQNITLL